MEATLGLRTVQAGRGTVHWVEKAWLLDHRHGCFRLGDVLALDDQALRRLAPGLSLMDLADVAFLDIETTGLAGGTGTYVFLVGVGTFSRGSFTLRQFFLADLRDEPAMLEAVIQAIAARPALVSFNGRRFDLPLLLTRLTLSRVREPAHREHLDLLYPARRLYGRRLESCALGALEVSILGMTRNGDVPGSLVPSIYFDYLRTGNVDPLRAVFEHNALDILSLVTLLAHLGQVCGRAAKVEAEDYLALGHWDQHEGRHAGAISMYRAALQEARTEEMRSAARRRLARLYRSRGWAKHAVGLWREEAQRGRAEGKVEALVELAKVEEHQHRDFAAAEALTERALRLVDVAAFRGLAIPTPQLQRQALEYRLCRLRRRLAAANAR